MSASLLANNNSQTSTQPAKANAAQRIENLKGGVVGQLSALQLTAAENQQAIITEYNALEKIGPNQTLNWQDVSSGTIGVVTPLQPYRVGTQDCRAYTHAITKNGRTLSGRGTACRNESGDWEFLV